MLAISTSQIIAEVRWRAAALDPGLRRMILEMAERLETLDQVEAVPVVHGYWVDTQHQRINSKGKLIKCFHLYHCSECGADRPIVPPYNYCPNCGAKMDGDGNG